MNFFLRLFSSETYVVEDCTFYSSDCTGLTGTYTTGSDGTYDYITSIGSGTKADITLPSTFTVEYKLYVPSTTSSNSLLWVIGTNTSNGVLLGTESYNTKVRIYKRTNGSNSVISSQENVYSIGTWIDVTLTYDGTNISIDAGSASFSYALSSTSVFQNYSSNSGARISEYKIKPL